MKKKRLKISPNSHQTLTFNKVRESSTKNDCLPGVNNPASPPFQRLQMMRHSNQIEINCVTAWMTLKLSL
jgi:hypothetical protein